MKNEYEWYGKHLDGVLNVLINDVNILSEKVINDLLGFPNVAPHAFLDNILALGIRTYVRNSVWVFFPYHYYLFSYATFLDIFLTIMYLTSRELDPSTFLFKLIEICLQLKFGNLRITLNKEH